jgi:hypothetical protein
VGETRAPVSMNLAKELDGLAGGPYTLPNMTRPVSLGLLLGLIRLALRGLPGASPA